MENVKWSGKGAIPAVGDTVNVRLNSIGEGCVTGYFVQDGYVGVKVKIFNPPEWMKCNNPEGEDSFIFGAEIK